jgi:hypothetical protein
VVRVLLSRRISVLKDKVSSSEDNSKEVTAKSTNVIEDLGQVSSPLHSLIHCASPPCSQIGYLMMDKTGTLTRNEMKLKKFSIRGKIYGDTSGNLRIHKLFFFLDDDEISLGG